MVTLVATSFPRSFQEFSSPGFLQNQHIWPSTDRRRFFLLSVDASSEAMCQRPALQLHKTEPPESRLNILRNGLVECLCLCVPN
jgi:hypothetical protein